MRIDQPHVATPRPVTAPVMDDTRPHHDDRRPQVAATRRLLAGLGALALAATSLALHPTAAAADPTDVPVEEVADAIDASLEEHLGEVLPGATVAVVADDEVILAEGYGTSDVDTGAPVDPDRTAFHIGSTSKPVTGTAVMQGVEDGMLDLDADVNTYLDDSAVTIPDTFDEPITLRHLATHTAGFDDPANPGATTDPDEVDGLEDALAAGLPDRVTPPGEVVAYSNFGAALAGHVAAQAYDTDFETLVDERIFRPLGMTHSAFAQPIPDDHPGEVAAPHELTGDGPVHADRAYIGWLPAGSMTATAADMGRFMRAHLGDGSVDGQRILGTGTLEQMHEVHEDRHPAVTGFRFMFMDDARAADSAISHGGATMHETTEMVLLPDHDLGVFVSFNLRDEAVQPWEVVEAVLAAYDITPETGPDTPTTGDDAGDRAQRLDGEYAAAAMPQHGLAGLFGAIGYQRVSADGDGRLTLPHPLGSEASTFVEVDEYVFAEVDGPDMLAADVEDGEVVALHRSLTPQDTLTPTSRFEGMGVSLATLGLPLVAFGLSLLGWAIIGGVRAWRRRTATSGVTSTRTSVGPARVARWSAVALSLTVVAFAGAFALGMALGGGDLAFVVEPLPLRFAAVLSYLVPLATGVVVVATLLAWRRAGWSWPVRLHQSAVGLLGVAFTWQLTSLGVLGG